MLSWHRGIRSPCRVSVRDLEGVTHSIDVQAGTLFEAAAAAIAAFRLERWAGDALTPNAVLRVEVQLPPVIHDVPMKAVEQWLRAPNESPRDVLAKRKLG